MQNLQLQPTAPTIMMYVLSLALLNACNNKAVLPESVERGFSQPPSTSSSGTSVRSSGWKLTVYYTAVESFHSGEPTQISGCLEHSCKASGTIGIYPSDFAEAVQNEGTGRITSGTHAGEYLNWSYDIGYWLDSSPKDAYGNELVPYVSSAADADVLSSGTRFQVADCGHGVNAEFCTRLKEAEWQITDQFTPGYGGEKHLDLYIGEEDQDSFESTSPKYITTEEAVLLIPAD